MRKLVFGVSDKGLGCTAFEAGYRLEILDLESRGIALCMQRKQRC